MNTTVPAMLLAVSLAGVAVPATAHADCGQPGQPPCTGPAPTVDQVVAIMNELTDPNKPAVAKTDAVTPGFTPDEAAGVDFHNHRFALAGLLPFPFVVTNIQPAPNNFAGATVATTGSPRQVGLPKPIVLVNEHGRWLITHDSAMTELNSFVHNANRFYYEPDFIPPVAAWAP